MRRGSVGDQGTVVLWDAEEFERETRGPRDIEKLSRSTVMGGRQWEDEGFVDVDLGEASVVREMI